jgi:hypothetical protein
MIQKLKAALSPLYYVFNPQQRWLTKQFRRTWMDKDEIIFHTLFGCIVHWVEVEGVESRSASWDEDLAAGYVTQQYVDEKQKIEDKITEIYLWHTNGRKLLEADAQKLLDNAIDLLHINSTASRFKIYKAIRKIQDKIEKQDQMYMKEIVKLSGYLWT